MEGVEKHPRFGYLAGTGEEVASTIPKTIREARVQGYESPYDLEIADSLYKDPKASEDPFSLLRGILGTGSGRFGPTQAQRIELALEAPPRVIHLGADEMTNKQRKAANRQERRRAQQAG